MMRMIRLRAESVLFNGTTFVVLACLAATATAADKIPGVGPTGPVEKVAGDFAFTEGPAADASGNLYFTDIPNQRIWRLDPDGKMEIFREPSGHANGLMVDREGWIVACEMDGQLVALHPDGKQRRVLADKHGGNRFNAPNDLVIDRHGGIYFTDPMFRAPTPLPQEKTAVYYRSADGAVARLVDDLANPNGVILSPDEKVLYVIPSGQSEMMAYPITAPGKIGPGKVLCKLKQPAGQTKSGGDGLTIDTAGNLYITSALGLQVVSPAGEILGIIELPEQPANVTFGGDGKTLFATCRTSLYKVPTSATGHVFARP